MDLHPFSLFLENFSSRHVIFQHEFVMHGIIAETYAFNIPRGIKSLYLQQLKCIYVYLNVFHNYDNKVLYDIIAVNMSVKAIKLL